MILEPLTERFGDLSKGNDHGEDKSGTAITGDSILRDVCWVLDSQKRIVPENMVITLEAVDAVLEKNIESISKIFDHLALMFKKSHQLSQLRQLLTSVSALLCMQWRIITTSSTHHWRCGNCWIHLKMNNIFLIAELCFCAPCSNAFLKRFFSQMRIVKTDWRNSLSESNLALLLRIKVSGPTLKSLCWQVLCKSH